ncbi:MAG: citrate lyase subunit beta/citryl-CoA lyase [Candidatus Aldehydirespiratoraceae bacterium]|jgi:citrate lyase subunit beta/citryl-CoA lyase
MGLPRRLRSLLFAPAVRPDLVAKMPATGADLITIDLEDATPVHAKAAARASLPDLMASVVGPVAVAIRVNDPSTEWFDADMAAIPDGVSAVVVPKIETAADIAAVRAALERVNRRDLQIIAGLETALGVADARLLLQDPVVGAAYFGAEDFIADMGGVRTASNNEVAYARSQLALAGRLAEVPVLDQVVADFRDDDRSRREDHEARAMGYAGKLCIHPSQVAIANDVFTPSPEEVDRARRLLAAYDEASAGGIAAIDFEGQMVDEPVARQARQLLTLAED